MISEITGGLTAFPDCLYNCVSLIPFFCTLSVNSLLNPCTLKVSNGVSFRIWYSLLSLKIIFGLSDLANNVGDIP